MAQQEVIAKVKVWLHEVVIGLGLCPFAFEVYSKDQILYRVLSFRSAEDFLKSFSSCLKSILDKNSRYSTALIIVKEGLENFEDYLSVYHAMEACLDNNQLQDTFQLASFHPDYQFEDTDSDDVSNYTNRSPYPILHILKSETVEQAIDSHPDINQVPIDNIATMKKLGIEGMVQLLENIYSE